MTRLLVILVFLSFLGCGRAEEDEEVAKKAVRMKTSRQLKEILSELGIPHDGLDKEELRELALAENAVPRYEEIHPEKKRKPRWRTPGGAGDPTAFDGMEPPEGMDKEQWERLTAQMRGDFSAEVDPEKRRILEKLKKAGISMGGGNDMDLETLRNLEKAIGSDGKFGTSGSDSEEEAKDEV